PPDVKDERFLNFVCFFFAVFLAANKRIISKHNKDSSIRAMGSSCETSEGISSQQHSAEIQPVRRSSPIPTFNQTGNLLPTRDPVRSPPRINGITRRVSVNLMESELLSSTEKEIANSRDDQDATRCTRRRKNREISKESENADVYLLDDPLSAVDSHVAQHLFDGVLGPHGLLKEKTRFWITNSFQWLSQADWIVVLDEHGQIAQSGRHQDIVDNTQGHFADYLRLLEEQLSRTKNVRSPPRINGITRRVSVNLMESELLSSTEKEIANSRDDQDATRCTRRRKNREISKESETASTEVPSGTLNFQTSTAVDSGAITTATEQEFGRFLEDEEVNQGHISWSAYANYIIARGLSLTVVSILFYVLFLGAQVINLSIYS
ncbi:hypothetical protein AHF37_09395, partial [Paragonimus kellicotti]